MYVKFSSLSFSLFPSAPINSITVPPTVEKTMCLWNSTIKFYAAIALIVSSVHLLARAGLDKTQMSPFSKRIILFSLNSATFQLSLFMFGFPPSALAICTGAIFSIGMLLAFPPAYPSYTIRMNPTS